MATATKEKKETSTVLFSMHGVEVRSDSKFRVKDKPDPSAPSGLEKLGVTKVPSEGVEEVFQFPFSVSRYDAKTRETEGVWITGFDADEPIYQGEERSVALAAARNLTKSVLEPFRKLKGNPTIFSNENKASFDNYLFAVRTGKVYRGDNPENVMELYAALLGKKIVPESQRGNPDFRDASYELVDETKARKQSDDRAVAILRAAKMFDKMYETDVAGLRSVLKYMDMTISTEVDEETMMIIFMNFLERERGNIDYFRKTVDMYATQKGEEEIKIYAYLKDNFRKDREIIKGEKGSWFYGTIEIGPDRKTAANRIANLVGMAEIKKKILLADEE